ncbi:F0F1 ATP synthase subunit B family protein [Phaeacidiphilus oryzae]|uniref:F0F1 ATP synthase subunit B family protein n=1 Tax=Phaeacidiphilus oryzae TaxID=348818 RepID=UPI00055CD94E|nr:hypothetical protein [Phaeacidiphilus oryzae]
MGPLIPDRYEFLLALLVFGVVFGLLGRVLLPRIQRTLAAREDAIGGGLARAETARAQAEETLAEYRAQLSEARHEGARIRHAAEQQGAELLARLRAEGQAERERMKAEAAERMELDRLAVAAELRADIALTATALAERMLGEPLPDRARTDAVVDAYFEELDAAEAAQAGPSSQ